MFWRHKALVVLGLAIGLVLGALYYSRQPPVFQSSAQLIVIKKQGNPLPDRDDGRGLEDYLTTHQILMKSPVIVRIAVTMKDSPIRSLKSFEGMGDPTHAIIGGLIVQREGKDTQSYNNILNLSFSG